MSDYDKSNCLERARKLLATTNDDSLNYACLELRYCIEAIVYEKLNLYSHFVPEVVFSKWQPNHAIKMLLQFEPYADENFEIFISPESSPGVPTGKWFCLGQHKTFKLSWLNKNYNKIGSYLHLKMSDKKIQKSADEISAIRKDIEKIFSEVESIINSSVVDSALASRIQFQCQECKQISCVHVDVLHKTGRATCINPQCGADYIAKKDDLGWNFKLAMTSFTCHKCTKTSFLENRHIEIGMKFRCMHCGELHMISGGHWIYERIVEEKNR